MPDPSIKHLRAFLAVVDERNVPRAAERLGTLPNTLATRIRVLEQAVGQKLLERHMPPGRKEVGCAKPTEAGLAFLPKAIEAVRVWDTLLDPPPDIRKTDQTDHILATSLLEIALTVLRQDLSEDRRQEIYALLEF